MGNELRVDPLVIRITYVLFSSKHVMNFMNYLNGPNAIWNEVFIPGFCER